MLATPQDAAPQPIRREDYQPPDFAVPTVRLHFALHAEHTHVTCTLQVERNRDHTRPLRLHGDGLTPRAVRVDGRDHAWRLDGSDLVLDLPGRTATVETEVEIAPARNSQLMGLYASGGLLCTQCEAEGFRRITFFPDRPDVLSRYFVRLEADRKTYPVLLCNGDRVGHGELPDGRHYAEWNDPFPKPSYLFALVAGDLQANHDTFTTRSGRNVELAIWVAADDVPKTAHAMHALKLAMAWDEEVYGREYDLAMFNIVAVHDFNFGAMENKGLNIFNASYVLADPATATDTDYDGILGVVAHEYFHNWSGNRVTCRDWFQLSLKEGFTVFRDQCFSADQGSAAVQRISDVRRLRAAQFQEDAGPLAHPIRPESFIDISNFYTATVYEKGAEVIRMMHTLLGAAKFRAGSDLYFQRHDGQAVTCEDFVKAMEDASGVDLTQFRRWYSYAGTPHVKASLEGRTLTLTQTIPDTPGQTGKQPMTIPLRLAAFERSNATKVFEDLVVLTERETRVALPAAAQSPVLSLGRNFSAPIIIERPRAAADLAFLSAHDDDPFGRYEALQQLMLSVLLDRIAGKPTDEQPVLRAIDATLSHDGLDPALVAEAVVLPTEGFIGDQLATVDPDAIFAARDRLRTMIGRELAPRWQTLYAKHAQARYEYSPAAKGARRLRNVALSYLVGGHTAEAFATAHTQFRDADNMTDKLTALGVLVSSDAPARSEALATFYQQYRTNPLVLNKWFATQAASSRADTLATVRTLAAHPDYTLTNPNRVRSLLGTFAANQCRFHDASGAGYQFLAAQIGALNAVNPQVAARLVPPLGQWRRFDAGRQTHMRAALQSILATPDLAKDVFEQVSKCLASE